MEILKVQNLSKTYGNGETRVDALKNVSFTMNKGEFAAVVGESGSGKSTLLNCIGGLETPTSGKIYINNDDIFKNERAKKNYFQEKKHRFCFSVFSAYSRVKR